MTVASKTNFKLPKKKKLQRKKGNIFIVFTQKHINFGYRL